MMDEFYTIKNSFDFLTIIEHSKFICILSPIETEKEAKDLLLVAKKQYPLATHYCYAYILDEEGLNSKCSDDGEPQGTAGVPILETLKNKNLKKVIAIVVRYFGGIKLGTGGLARAYSGVVLKTIEKSDLICMRKAKFYTLICDYDLYNKQRLYTNQNVVIIKTIFDKNVILTISVASNYNDEFIKKISSITCGKQNLNFIKEDFFGFKVKNG